MIKRTVGGMKSWLGVGVARYKGLKKTYTQHVLAAITYNLCRAPGIYTIQKIGLRITEEKRTNPHKTHKNIKHQKQSKKKAPRTTLKIQNIAKNQQKIKP